MCADRGPWWPGSLRARVKAPIVIFIPLFHSNALLGRTALLFTRVKAMFLPQTRPNVKTILFWLARNSFLLPDDGQARSGRISSWAGIMRWNDGQNIELSYYWLSWFCISTAFISPESIMRPLGHSVLQGDQKDWVFGMGLLRLLRFQRVFMWSQKSA